MFSTALAYRMKLDLILASDEAISVCPNKSNILKLNDFVLQFEISIYEWADVFELIYLLRKKKIVFLFFSAQPIISILLFLL